MNDYFHGVIVCDGGGNRILCEAPTWPEMREGDKVLFSATPHEAEGACLTSSMYLSTAEQSFIATGMGEMPPFPRVLGRIKVERFEYEDEKTPEGEDTPTDDING